MSKYRIKLKNDRVVGPFNIEQIIELFSKGHINGSESFQKFPVGEWSTLNNLKELKSALSNYVKTGDTPVNTSDTVQKKISAAKKIRNIESQDVELPELEYDDEEIEEVVVDYEEMERRYNEELEKEAEISKIIKEEVEPEDEAEKTVVLRKSPVQNIDKTVVVNPQVLKEEEEETEDEVVVEEEPKEEIDTEEKTVFINLPSVKKEIEEDDVESDILEIEKKLMEARKESSKEKKVSKDDVEDEVEEKKTLKKTRPIMLLVLFLLVYYLTLDDKKPTNEFKPINAKITFPVTNKYIDDLKSEQALIEGVKLYEQGHYKSKLAAAAKFRESLSHKFKDNKSLGHLILVYAEVFENAKNKEKAAKTIFELLQIAQSKALTDRNVALGSSIFYSKIEKYYTSINIIENYLRLNRPSVPLYAQYLKSLIKAGQLDKAKKAFSKLESVKKKPQVAVLAMSNYLAFDERHEEAIALMNKQSKRFKSRVPFLLAYADLLIKDSDFKKLSLILQEVERLNSEYSPLYYAEFFEKMGVLSAFQKDQKNATKFFGLALKLHESDRLRSILAQLEQGGDSVTSFLIRESKVKDFLNRANKQIMDNDWDGAFKTCLKASEVDEGNIDVMLLISRIQAHRGYYSSAIKTLEELRKVSPLHPSINFELFQVYLKTFDFSEAKRLISSLSQTRFAKSYWYASMIARYYAAVGNLKLASKHFNESISRNPLNDRDYFEHAKLYAVYRKYRNSKIKLQRAILLDPRNIEYRSLFANLLYELEGAGTAISYLLDLLETHPDNSTFIGDIAFYYFKEQNFNEFNVYKKQLESLRVKDSKFYHSMIKAAEIEGRVDDVVKYLKELISIEPGDLESRMKLATVLLTNEKYKPSLNELGFIESRISTYPKLNYLIATVYLKIDKPRKAQEYALKEVKENPNIEEGYYILGESYRRLKMYKEAQKRYEKAIALNPKYVDALMSLGWLKLRQRYFDEARELYSRALLQDENNPRIHRQLGYVYRAVGQSRLAIESFNVYLTLLPNAKDRGTIENIIRQLK